MHSQARRADAIRALEEALHQATRLTDLGSAPPGVARRRDRLARLLGRDPVIERAKGAVTERLGVTRGEAFELLREISQHRNLKLRDVAALVVEADVAGRPLSGVFRG